MAEPKRNERDEAIQRANDSTRMQNREDICKPPPCDLMPPPLSSALAANRTLATYSTSRVIETTYDGLNRPQPIVEGGCLTCHGYDLNCSTKSSHS